jgi:hypothetical protein
MITGSNPKLEAIHLESRLRYVGIRTMETICVEESRREKIHIPKIDF